MENTPRSNFKELKKPVIEKITTDLMQDGRSIVRGLGTFKVVTHKAKVNNLGNIPERKRVKFSATRSLNELVNKKKR